jgi:hypothetical protein
LILCRSGAIGIFKINLRNSVYARVDKVRARRGRLPGPHLESIINRYADGCHEPRLRPLSRRAALTSSVELARHEAENSNRSECVATLGRGVQCRYDDLRDITSDLSGFDRVIG